MNSPIPYTKLSRRIRALLIDGIFLSMVIFATIFLVKKLHLQSSPSESILIILVVISLEPLLVSFTGASVGHHLVGLRIRRASVEKRLNLFLSYLRYIVKLPTGLISLIPVLTTRKHQAIHDILSDSIVVHKAPEKVPAYEVLSERVYDTETYIYPSKIRRSVFIFLYLTILFISVGIMSTLIYSESCLDMNQCTNLDSITGIGLSVLFWVGLFVIVGLGWQARLYGCKKRAHNAEQ